MHGQKPQHAVPRSIGQSGKRRVKAHYAVQVVRPGTNQSKHTAASHDGRKKLMMGKTRDYSNHPPDIIKI